MHEIIDKVFQILRGIWRYRWIALAVAWLVCLGGWAYVYKLPDQYSASARVYVDTQSILRPLLRGLAVDINPGSQIALMTRTLLSRPNLEKVARMTDLDLRAKDSRGMDRLVSRLRGSISLSSGGRQNLYTIRFRDRDPQLAKRAVQAILTIFVENTLGETRQDSDTAQRFLDRQIAEYEARLVAAENRLKEFKRKNLGRMPSSGQGYYQRLQAARQQLKQAELALQQAQNRRDTLLDELEIAEEEDEFQPPFFEQQEEGDVPGVTTIALPIDARIQAIQQRLDALLLQYTERHPDVMITRQAIAGLEEQRKEQLAQVRAMQMRQEAESESGLPENPYLQQLKIALVQEEANVASLEKRLQAQRKTVEHLSEMVDVIPEIEVQLKALNRDYGVTQSNYQALLSRREQAYLSQQVEQTTDNIRFRVVDPPRVPNKPSGPDRPALMSSVLGAGLGIGIAIAALLAQIMPTFDSRRSLMEATNIPVLGTVDAILSPISIRRQRLGLIIYVALGLCLMAVFVTLLFLQAAGIKLV